MGVRLLTLPAMTYLYLCTSGKHYVECHAHALPDGVVLLNAGAQNGMVWMLLESRHWDGGDIHAPIDLPEPEFRVLRVFK